MILVLETNWSGTVHAPGNAATIQAIARGYPEQAIRVFAEPGHLAELRADAGLAAVSRLDFQPIALYPHFQGRPGVVSFGRLRHEFGLFRAALATVPAGEPALLMLISTTSTGIFAAALAARLRGRTKVQVGLHGDLNEIGGWRSRHPLRRALDLDTAMGRDWRDVRFLVLEDAIRSELARRAPAAAARTDVLPLPINAGEAGNTALPLAPPIRFGFVGQATEAKGIGAFLDLARAIRARFGDRAEFDVIGRADPRLPPPDASDLISPVATDYLSRAEFTRRLAALHYVVLPLGGDYYRLAASGALIDAITWLKPVLAGPAPIVEAWFQDAGDIGAICPDTPAMIAAATALLEQPDPARYERQVANLRAARARRTPDALGDRYRALMAGFFPPR